MAKRIIEDMQLLPFGWTGKRTNYSNVYIAPNLLAAKDFLNGGNKTRQKGHQILIHQKRRDLHQTKS